jgi:hypothetical protein
MRHCRAEFQRLPSICDPAGPLAVPTGWLRALTVLADLEDMGSGLRDSEVLHALMEAAGDTDSQRHRAKGCWRGKNNTYQAAQPVITPPGLAPPSAASAGIRTGDSCTAGRIPRSAKVMATWLCADLTNYDHKPMDPSRAAVLHAAVRQLRIRTFIQVRGLSTLCPRGPLTCGPRR